MSERVFERKPDSGQLNASKSKKTEKSPDYWGEIAININDMTNVTEENGFLVFKISGWKKVSKAGTTYLSLAVNRMAPEGYQRATKEDDPF